MKRLILFMFLSAIILSSCSTEPQAVDNGCSPDFYKSRAISVMESFQVYSLTIDLHDTDSLRSVESELNAFLRRAKSLDCKEEYSLKHETLEYSILHMIDVVKYAREGKLTEAQQSLIKVEINVNQFYNWSVDMD